MGNVRPLIDYLSASTTSTLESFELTRLNTSSNSERKLSKMLGEHSHEHASMYLARHLIKKHASSNSDTRASMSLALPTPLGSSESISAVSKRPNSFSFCCLLPLICIATAPQISCSHSAPLQSRQVDIFEADLATQQPDNGNTCAAANALVVLPHKRNRLTSERLRRLKCVQPAPKKQLLRMPPTSVISPVRPHHHSTDLPLLRTGTD